MLGLELLPGLGRVTGSITVRMLSRLKGSRIRLLRRGPYRRPQLRNKFLGLIVVRPDMEKHELCPATCPGSLRPGACGQERRRASAFTI